MKMDNVMFFFVQELGCVWIFWEDSVDDGDQYDCENIFDDEQLGLRGKVISIDV